MFERYNASARKQTHATNTVLCTISSGHVRSCGFGQERHFRLDNCFDCEVHYIRNEVNRLQIKMRRAMKEDKTLSEEQRKTAREPITREEVEKGKLILQIARAHMTRFALALCEQPISACVCVWVRFEQATRAQSVLVFSAKARLCCLLQLLCFVALHLCVAMFIYIRA